MEKGGGFAVRIFPEGWVLSQDCQIQAPISLCHTLSTTGRYGVLVRDMYGGWYIEFCLRYGGLFH